MKYFLQKEGTKLEMPEDDAEKQGLRRITGRATCAKLRTIRRCIALATGDAINVEDLPPEITQATRLPPGEEAPQGLVGDPGAIDATRCLMR